MSEPEDQAKAQELLNEIDGIAFGYDSEVYGLPSRDDTLDELGRETVDKLERLVIKTLRDQRADALNDAAEGLTRRFLGLNDKLPHDVAECVAILMARAQQVREGGTPHVQ